MDISLKVRQQPLGANIQNMCQRLRYRLRGHSLAPAQDLRHHGYR